MRFDQTGWLKLPPLGLRAPRPCKSLKVRVGQLVEGCFGSIGRKRRPALKCRVLDVWPIDKNSACADKCIAPTSLACTAPGWGIGGPALAHDSDARVLRLCGPLPCRVLSKKRAYQDGEIRPKRSVRC